MTGIRFLILLAGVILAGVGIASTMIILANAGRYDVLTDRIKSHLMAAIAAVVIGLIVVLLALVVIPGNAWAQTGPPPGWVKAKVSTCQPYNPSSCQYRTVWLRDSAWCGKSTRWWSPQDSTQTVQVSCVK
jgi:apolipoprotein N-acyltransferase